MSDNHKANRSVSSKRSNGSEHSVNNENKNHDFIYGSAGKHNEYIVKMKLLKDSVTDLDRPNVYDSDYARFNTNKAMVTDIRHKIKDTRSSYAQHCYNSKFYFRIGEIAEVPGYDPKKGLGYGKGIGFYQSHYAAFCYDIYEYSTEIGYNGYFNVWYIDGRLWKTGRVNNGQLVGEYKEYYENQSLKLSCYYHVKRKSLHGMFRRYNKHGMLLVDSTYRYGKLNGYYKDWHKNRSPKTNCWYDSGTLDGPYEEWYDNYTRKTRCQYVNGKINGLYEKWSRKGILIETSTYRNGILHGEHQEWFDEKPKQIKTKCTYNDNKLDSFYQTWDSDGSAKQNIPYNKGKEVTGDCYRDSCLSCVIS